jgi:hypothetical protein
MTCKERGVIFVNGTYLTKSSLMPNLEGLEEVYFDVELVQFIQVQSKLIIDFVFCSLFLAIFVLMHLFITFKVELVSGVF